MVFRKLVDVQREKELAERRKDDPPLDVSTDLAVRKLLSRLQRRTTENHRLVTVASQAELGLQNDDAAEEQTGNGGISSNSSSNMATSKPSAKLQFAKLLRGTVASAATTSSTAGAGGAGTPPTMTTSTPPSRDGSPTAGRPPSRTAAIKYSGIYGRA